MIVKLFLIYFYKYYVNVSFIFNQFNVLSQILIMGEFKKVEKTGNCVTEMFLNCTEN